MKIQLLATWLLSLALGPLAYATVNVDELAPALEFTTLSGTEFNLQKLRGKPVIIHFWATWCSACRQEMPLLSQFYQKHRVHLEMVALSADRRRDRDLAIKSLKELGLPGAMLGDVKVNGFGSPGLLPITYVVDPQGIVRKIFLPGSEANGAVLTESNLIGVLGPKFGVGK